VPVPLVRQPDRSRLAPPRGYSPAAGTAQPTTTNLNFAAGRTVSNLAVLPIGPDGTIDVWNHYGSVDVVTDVYGYFG
jgi:hypothetical protein